MPIDFDTYERSKPVDGTILIRRVDHSQLMKYIQAKTEKRLEVEGNDCNLDYNNIKLAKCDL